MKMSTIAILFALLFIALGLFGFISYQAKTALIPAYIGIVLLICGWMARKDEWRMHAMHGAALIGIIGFLGSVQGLLKLPKLLAGEALDRPHAVALQSIMAILCVIFIALCVKSFIDVRIARRRAEALAKS